MRTCIVRGIGVYSLFNRASVQSRERPSAGLDAAQRFRWLPNRCHRRSPVIDSSPKSGVVAVRASAKRSVSIHAARSCSKNRGPFFRKSSSEANCLSPALVILRHSREITQVCSRRVTHRPNGAGDENALPICGLRAKVRCRGGQLYRSTSGQVLVSAEALACLCRRLSKQ